jgi:2-dehydro-3-deoxyphosphogalactonate aldolase
MTLEDAMAEMPIVAIIRGVRPNEVTAIADALYRGGIRIVEIPLNSPDPLVSLHKLAQEFAGRIVCGAGTVLNPAQVRQVADAGGLIVVSPNVDTQVIASTLQAGLASMPGFLSPTEGFAAITAGARVLKLFPASTVGPAHLSAIRAVFESGIRVLPVGGVTLDTMAVWREAGAAGFGLGSELYRPGQSPEATYQKAGCAVAALRASGKLH